MEGSMVDYFEDLLLAINCYDENDMDSKEKLRNIVCHISENKIFIGDPIISELLYIASLKMRVFGYNYLNGLNEDPNKNVRSIDVLRNESIKNIHQSNINQDLLLDRSQKEIVDFFQSLKKKRMLVSAPTSYGKTFLMREILFLNMHRYNNILLIFPTIALLKENETEMVNFVKDNEQDYHVTKSIYGEIDTGRKNIFVFTPERALQLLASHPNINIDFFFFDEVYKIDEDYSFDEDFFSEKKNSEYAPINVFDINRAKTFRITLYLLSKLTSEYYLAGPNIHRDSFGEGMLKYISVNDIQVKEVLFEPTVRIKVVAHGNNIIEESVYPVSKKTHSIDGSNVGNKLSEIISYIDSNNYGKTIVYCMYPAKANGYAKSLAEKQNRHIIKSIDDDFINHIKNTYDFGGSAKKWSLVFILEQGFAVHHGKLPKYVQTEILNRFNHGRYNILFCTSTIVEGVNTKARNMVIMNHSKGREQLTPFDIKNIKGRAGRYYHNFVGRVFYADKQLCTIENSADLRLNLITYDSCPLGGVDIDNACIEDLNGVNKNQKKRRLEEQSKYLLSREVFERNRLIPMEYQEELLKSILIEFDNFSYLLSRLTLLDEFFEYNYLSRILAVVYKTKLIDENTKKRYWGIGNRYYKEGFRGILSYELSRENIKSVDQAYSNAFDNIRNVIEHKIPQILSLFEALLSQAAEIKGYNRENLSLSKVIRFFETGVKSVFGEELVSFGFPTGTVRRIEEAHSDFLNFDLDSSKKYYFLHKKEIQSLLDKYEDRLIKDAVKSIFK